MPHILSVEKVPFEQFVLVLARYWGQMIPKVSSY